MSVYTRGVGNEISITCFVFNVRSSISIFIYARCKYLDVGVVMAPAGVWAVRSFPRWQLQ